jgi:RHS repeat-associated protein
MRGLLDDGRVRKNVATTTFQFDNNGNLIQKTTDGTSTTYVYDYANRLIALGAGGATTTYGYDAFGQRVVQTGTSTTNVYPFKWYSIASSTATGAKYSTTTEYVFNGDTLLSTVDQQIAGGAATGTAQTRYIHPDHLGSTNVVTNASGTVVQTLDYYPYGATRISTNVGGAGSARKYIGQFADMSGLNYLQARYQDPQRGQFISQDPTFLALGNPDQLKQLSQQDQQKFLSDPQQMNSYSYGRDNPITQKDPNGNQYVSEAADIFFYQPLYIFGGVKGTVNGLTYMTNYSQLTPEQRVEGRNDLMYKGGAFGLSTAALLLGIPSAGMAPVAAGAIDMAELVSSGKSIYCSSHVCKDFSGGQKTIGEILSGIPKGAAPDFSLSKPVIKPRGNGAPATNQGSAGASGNGSSKGSSSSGGSGSGAASGSGQSFGWNTWPSSFNPFLPH